MARLLTDAEVTPSTSSATTDVMGEASEPRGKLQNVTARRLSFKTRQTPRNYRSTKVTLSSNNVSLIASKFNKIVIEDDAKGRALLRRLSSVQRKPVQPKSESKNNTLKKLAKPESTVKAAIQIFESQDEPDVAQKTTKTVKPKLVLVRKQSSIKQSKTETVNLIQSAKEVISAKTDSELSLTKEPIKKVDFQRKPSLKEKPLLRNINRSRYTSDLGFNFNQRLAKFNNSDDVKPVESVNKSVDSVKNRRSLGNEISQRIERLNVNDGSKFGKKEQVMAKEGITEKKENIIRDVTERRKLTGNIIPENKENVVKDIAEKAKFTEKLITEKTESAVNGVLGKTKPTDRKENSNNFSNYLSYVEKENKNSKVISEKPPRATNLIDLTKDRFALNNKDNNTKPKIQPKPNVVMAEKRPSSLYNEKLFSTESKSLRLYKTSADILHKENDSSKRLSIPKDPTILEHVFDADEPTNNKEVKAKSSLARPNNSFLWKSNSLLCVTEIPIIDAAKSNEVKKDLDVRNEKEMKQPPPTKPKNGFKIAQISIVNKTDESKQLGDLKKSEIDAGSKTVNGFPVNSGVSKEKFLNSFNIDVASSFSLEMNQQIEKRFSNDLSNYEIICNKTEENMIRAVITQNKSSLYNSDLIPKETPTMERTAEKYKSNENLQKLLVEELVTRNFSSLQRRSAEIIFNADENSSPKLPPPNRNSSALLKTDDRTNPALPSRDVVSNDNNSKVPPPVLRHLKKNHQGLQKTEDSSSCEDYFSSKFSQSSDHYTLVGGDEELEETHDTEAYEDVGEQENCYAVIKEYEDERHNIYDDVLNMHGQVEDHYESINPIINSQPDSDSSCDQSNSLYGIRPPSRSSSGGGYQVTGPGYQPAPRSETSDEWMDLDNSDDQNEQILVFREKDKPTRTWSSAGGWSQKVRRQWSKRAINGHGDYSSDGSSPHPYEFVEEADDSTICDDFDDSFDSDTSVDDTNEDHHKKEKDSRVLPDPPRDGIYGFMKQAGKRMRKHWSLGKSLRRISKISVGSASAHQTSFNQSHNNSSGTSLNRKRWSSFKSKFKPPVQNQSMFYLNSSNEESEKQTTPEVNYGESRVDPRRLSTASMIRPSSPPPPPPPPRNPTSDASKKTSFLNDPERKMSTQSDDGNKRLSSMVDDTGKKTSLINSLTKELISTFDRNDSNGTYAEGQQRLTQTSNSNWYLDVSWPSTDSASEHGSSQGSDLHLTFADEPLYQIYTAYVAEMSRTELNDDSDGYEEIASLVNRPSAMDLVQQPHHRTLWGEIPEVKNSGVLDQLSPAERKLQEAKFEVMTSEASYFKSMTVLDKHFASCPIFADETILPSKDRKTLFSNVNSVRKSSEKLLAALEKCWQNSILLSGLCKILYEHVQNHFYTYVKYCSNQIYLDKTLKRLKTTNPNFNDILTQLEADPQCQSLSLHSFLMLPMQRITRMPLLVDAILSRLNSSDPEFGTCEILLATLNKYVTDCNEGARRQERYEEMLKLSQQLEFCKEVRMLPIISPSRWLVRSGQLTQINLDAKMTFGRRLTRTGLKITLFLFTDLLVVAKRKGDDSYLVIDYCQRNLVQMSEMNEPTWNGRYLLMLTMLENHEMKTVELLLCCESETVRQRWLQAVTPPTSSNPDETLYEDWDCPQVSAIHVYSGGQPDELSLQLGDVVNVFRKMTDGWYYGQRIRDGETGWFPANHTAEIASMHVRAKNLKQRWRFLALSGNYIQELQRKNKV